jgi:phage terminase large subunit-like protein
LLEQALLEGKLAHRKHPILSWNAANAVVERDAAMNRKVAKNRSYGRVDGIVALGIALHARDELGIVATGPSVYEDASLEMIL